MNLERENLTTFWERRKLPKADKTDWPKVHSESSCYDKNSSPSPVLLSRSSAHWVVFNLNQGVCATCDFCTMEFSSIQYGMVNLHVTITNFSGSKNINYRIINFEYFNKQWIWQVKIYLFCHYLVPTLSDLDDAFIFIFYLLLIVCLLSL